MRTWFVGCPLNPSDEKGNLVGRRTMCGIQTLDSDDHQSADAHDSRPPTPVPHIQVTSVHYASCQTQLQIQDQQSSLLCVPQHSPYSTPPNELSHFPTILLHPPTPVECHSQDALNSPMAQPPLQYPASPMHISPVSSWSASANSPSTHRKQRFTMGPRVDCEKCRLGVKGHWMHFD